jgi:putative oxidoreductase
MNQQRLDDLAKLLLRFTIGGLMLFHGISKLRHGIAPIIANVQHHHLPGFVGYGVFIGEVVAPIAIILGLYTRPAALVFAFNMLFAVWLVHTGDVGHLAKGGAWALELQWFYFAGALAVAALGAGRYALRGGKHRLDCASRGPG